MEGSATEDLEGPKSWQVDDMDLNMNRLMFSSAFINYSSKLLEHSIAGTALSDRTIPAN